MGKRGQSTVFVVLGIILLVVIITFIQLKEKSTQKEQGQTTNTPESIQEIKIYIQSCVEETIPSALFLLGAQGGYYNQQSSLPITEELFARELNKALADLLPRCTDFKKFKNVQIKTSKITTALMPKEESILITVDYPLEITSAGTEYMLKDAYEHDVMLRFNELFTVIHKIQQIDAKESIDLIALLNTEMDIGMIEEHGKTFYAITDKKSMIQDIPYTFIVEGT